MLDVRCESCGHKTENPEAHRGYCACTQCPTPEPPVIRARGIAGMPTPSRWTVGRLTPHGLTWGVVAALALAWWSFGPIFSPPPPPTERHTYADSLYPYVQPGAK